MSVSYSSNTVTINGGLANGEATVTVSQTLVRTTGDVPAASWVGRLIAFKPSSSESTNTQVRLVTAVSGNNVTVHDPWRNLGSLSGNFVIAHNLQDVHNIGNTSLKKIGDSTYQWDGDWDVTNNGFLGDLDISLEMRATNPSFQVDAGCVVQFGLLWGGEKNDSVETTNGCSIYFNKIVGGSSSYYQGGNSRNANGAVINYYGSIIQSKNPNPDSYSFQRMQGPMRFIGCSFDGPMGGRFYHEATEWAQCRMSGNDDATPAWSVGATFTRPVSDIIFFQNNTVMKNYQSFTGTFRDTVFTDSNGLIFNDSSGIETIRFIDCTTFSTSTPYAAQFKSINYVVTDGDGVPLPGAKVRINNATDVTQSAIRTSDASGVVTEILAKRSTGNTQFGPFRIRIRDYGKIWTELASPITDKIIQSVSLPDNINVTLDEATASSSSGSGAVSVFDYEGFTPLTIGGQVFSLEVTINPNIAGYPDTVEKVKHFLHWFGAQDAGIVFHEFAPMAGLETQRATYGSYGFKGVVITLDVNGDGSVLEAFPGFTRFQADNGNFWTPPVTYSLEFTGLIDGSEVRVYNGTNPATATEVGGVESVAGGVFSVNQALGGQSGFAIVHALNYQNIKIPITFANTDVSIPVQQNLDRQYNNPA